MSTLIPELPEEPDVIDPQQRFGFRHCSVRMPPRTDAAAHLAYNGVRRECAGLLQIAILHGLVPTQRPAWQGLNAGNKSREIQLRRSTLRQQLVYECEAKTRETKLIQSRNGVPQTNGPVIAAKVPSGTNGCLFLTLLGEWQPPAWSLRALHTDCALGGGYFLQRQIQVTWARYHVLSLREGRVRLVGRARVIRAASAVTSVTFFIYFHHTLCK
jgi:hypothetical protein